MYFFSGTGTSLAAAKEIQKNCNGWDIYHINKVLKNPGYTTDADEIGFIYPLYFGTVPDIFMEAVKNMTFTNCKYSFTIVTSGGGSNGYAIKHLKEILELKGVSLNYGESLGLNSNYIIADYYKSINKQGKALQKAITNFESKLVKISNDIETRKNRIRRASYLAYKIPHLISGDVSKEVYNLWDRDYSVTDSCKGCKACEKLCPVDNISIVGDRPVWQGKCVVCMGCIQSCTQKAIDFQSKCQNKNRFFYPNVSVNELIKKMGTG